MIAYVLFCRLAGTKTLILHLQAERASLPTLIPTVFFILDFRQVDETLHVFCLTLGCRSCQLVASCRPAPRPEHPALGLHVVAVGASFLLVQILLCDLNLNKRYDFVLQM